MDFRHPIIKSDNKDHPTIKTGQKKLALQPSGGFKLKVTFSFYEN